MNPADMHSAESHSALARAEDRAAVAKRRSVSATSLLADAPVSLLEAEFAQMIWAAR